jgi:CRISPR-associated protein Cas5d
MGYGITIRVRGGYALFTRPEMKVERVSYDVITPSAARGIIEAVYWKPAIRWVIDRIHVLNEIEFTNVRRNEVSEKISVSEVQRRMNGSPDPFYLSAIDARQQRAALVLKDVDYVIEAHFVLTDKASAEDTVEKHYNMALRRLDIIEDGIIIPKSPLTGVRDLGWMLYDLDFVDLPDIKPQFFKAEMREGVIDLTKVEVKQ